MLTPKIIDPASLPRRAHFDYFNAFANPYVGVTVEVDITPLMDWRSKNGAPFFLSLLYHVAQAANSVPEFRQRIREGKILEFPRCPTSHTVAKADGTYAYCVLESNIPFDEFLPIAINAQEKCRECGTIEEYDSAIASFFVSSVPWISYTGLVQPTPYPADSNVRISWGKYFQRNGRTIIPMSLLCHHALVDGRHLAQFYDALRAEMDKL
jgi:chloramphenicol O-acetyltransferase type A